MRKITEIILHCTATREGREVKVSEIDAWHRSRGWRCVGYHYVVGLDGRVSRGRGDDEAGAHCKGHNAWSLGVCYVGGVDASGNPKDTRTPEQKESLRRVVKELIGKYPGATVHCHNEFAAKACPCFGVDEL